MSDLKAKEKKINLKTEDDELENLIKLHKTVIRVVGTGGAGNNTITRLGQAGIHGIETLAVNTDAQDLLFTKSTNKLLIGKNITRGLGAGSDPQIGEEAMRENEKELKSFLEGADIVFVTCGLGGGTGTGSAPVIAEIARELGALTISVVTTPFSDEGILKEKNAASGLERLRKNSDTVIVVKNDRLLDLVPDLPINAAFKVADEILVNAVKGITELVTKKGLVNLDFADVRSIMKDGKTAMIGIGESESDNKVSEAVEKAINNPLLDVDVLGAQSALINIEGDENTTISDARNVMVLIAKKLDPNANIVWGASVSEDMKGKMRILIIATGLPEQSAQLPGFSELGKTDDRTTQSEKSDSLIDLKNIKSPVEIKFDDKHQADGDDNKPSKNVFNQIFEDEIRGDLNILRESLKSISAGNVDDKILSNIKKASMGIRNAAQLYSNKPVEDFGLFIGDVFELMVTKKLKMTSQYIPLLNKIPQIIQGMVSGYHIAVDDANQVIRELSLLLDQSS
ncbi:MAG: cell division protein FtsZ, partial [bacterium]|nr:cell division protein FtsZ [bacterium]